MVTRELFSQYVKEALEGYYDAVRLQTSPLVDLMALALAAGETRPARLRRLLREALETLRPPSTIPYGAREALSHRILWMHCIESRTQFEISEELGLSRTSYYRYLAEALDAVAGILWDQYQSRMQAGDQLDAARVEDEQAVEHAIRLADCSAVERVCLAEIIEDVLHTLAPLEQQQRIAIRVSLPDALPRMYCNPAMLRRILLTMLTEAIQRADQRTLDLLVTVGETETVWQIRGIGADPVGQSDSPLGPDLAVSRSLLAACGGRLWLDREPIDCAVLSFALPIIQPRTILLVDDDPDTTELYARYLRGEGHRLRVARTAVDVRALLAEQAPDLVILDVLLPGEDGWTILQQIKIMPETAHIPVIVCSVLSQPLLALALGASEVLSKPVAQEALVRAVTNALGSPDRPS